MPQRDVIIIPVLPTAKPSDHGADRDCGGDADQGQEVHSAEDQGREAVCPPV